jgi:hypothetical protein
MQKGDTIVSMIGRAIHQKRMDFLVHMHFLQSIHVFRELLASLFYLSVQVFLKEVQKSYSRVQTTLEPI